MEYEYRLLCQFTTVGATRCCLWLKQSKSNSLQGHMKHFSSYLGIEPSSSGWKAPGYSKNEYLVTLKTNYGKLKFLKTLCVALQRCRTECWYTAFCAQQREKTDVENCTCIEQPLTVTRLCTVMPNYNRMPYLATKNLVAFCRKVIQGSLWHTNFIHEHIPVTLGKLCVANGAHSWSLRNTEGMCVKPRIGPLAWRSCSYSIWDAWRVSWRTGRFSIPSWFYLCFSSHWAAVFW